jgi:hypothetical protein
MNEYTRAIHFKNGESKLITDDEMGKIAMVLENYDGKNKFITIQGEMISIDTIARVGSHHATAETQHRNESDLQRTLELNGQKESVDIRRKMIADKSMTSAIGMDKQTFKKLAGYKIEEKRLEMNKKMSSEESEKGNADYYLNEFNEKMFS